LKRVIVLPIKVYFSNVSITLGKIKWKKSK